MREGTKLSKEKKGEENCEICPKVARKIMVGIGRALTYNFNTIYIIMFAC